MTMSATSPISHATIPACLIIPTPSTRSGPRGDPDMGTRTRQRNATGGTRATTKKDRGFFAGKLEPVHAKRQALRQEEDEERCDQEGKDDQARDAVTNVGAQETRPLWVKSRHSAVRNGMSALPPRADMCSAVPDVRYGPIADILSVIADWTARSKR